MFGGDEEDEEINVGEWCELLDELLVRFDGSAEKLKEELSIASDREEVGTRRKEDLIKEERFRRRMEEDVKREEMKTEIKKKDLEFSRDQIENIWRESKWEIPQDENKKVWRVWFWNRSKIEIDQVQISTISPKSK